MRLEFHSQFWRSLSLEIASHRITVQNPVVMVATEDQECKILGPSRTSNEVASLRRGRPAVGPVSGQTRQI